MTLVGMVWVVSNGHSRVLIVGAGGHARVCLEALEDSGYEVVGAVSHDGLAIEGLDVPMLGREADLIQLVSTMRVGQVFVAIGDNDVRHRIDNDCVARGLVVAVAVSSHAMVSRRAELRAGAAMLPGAVVNAASVIGRGAIVNTKASVDHDCVIGDFAHIAPGVSICGGVRVGAGALVGVGASVAPGVTIGDGAVIGAGAAVVRDVPAWVTAVGVPARERGRTATT